MMIMMMMCSDLMRTLAVTLTFDPVTSKSDQFIFVPNCMSRIVNLVKFPRPVYIA